MAYENEQVGKIVLIKNLIFSCDNSSFQLEHAWRTGMPCLILYSDELYDYVLPLKHELRNFNY